MFILNLYFLVTLWILSSLPVAYLHETVGRYGELSVTPLMVLIMTCITVMVFSLPGIFKNVALLLLLFWSLSYLGFSMPASVSASFMAAGLSLINKEGKTLNEEDVNKVESWGDDV